MKISWRYLGLAGVFILLLPSMASAHPLHTTGAAGMVAGFLHPFGGLDHILAMLAVGIWAARAGGVWQWHTPLLFLTAAACACLLPSQFSLSLPIATETGVAASLLFLGGMIAFDVRRYPAFMAALVAMFGAFHGLAHGIEMAPGTSPWLFVAGFLAATAVLHAAGLLLGRMNHAARWLPVGGAGIATVGLTLLVLPA